MPPLVKESREEAQRGSRGEKEERMPDVIHLASAPTFTVDCPVDSPVAPVIVEDLTGYEVIKGRYFLVIKSSETDTLVQGECMDFDIPLPDKEVEREHHRHQLRRRGAKARSKHTEVAQAFSMLRSSSNLSEITIDEKDIAGSEFQCQRVSL